MVLPWSRKPSFQCSARCALSPPPDPFSSPRCHFADDEAGARTAALVLPTTNRMMVRHHEIPVERDTGGHAHENSGSARGTDSTSPLISEEFLGPNPAPDGSSSGAFDQTFGRRIQMGSSISVRNAFRFSAMVRPAIKANTRAMSEPPVDWAGIGTPEQICSWMLGPDDGEPCRREESASRRSDRPGRESGHGPLWESGAHAPPFPKR